MPKRCTKFVSEYLIPSLNTRRFGQHLKWIDKKNSIFELDWCHKGGPTWTEEEAVVFVEWDKIKGHYQPEDKQYFTKSKQRFRSLLYKLTHEGQIKKLKSNDKYKKVYSIGEKKLRKRKTDIRNSNTRSVSCSTDEMSSEDKEFMDEMSCKEDSCDNLVTNELSDHNYSSLSNSLNTHSDCEDQTIDLYKDSAVPTSLYEAPENLEKKVLVERNYPYNAYDMLLDEDLKTDSRNLTFTKPEGRMICDSMYELPFLMKNIDENLLPLADTLEFNQIYSPSSEAFDSSPIIFENFLIL